MYCTEKGVYECTVMRMERWHGRSVLDDWPNETVEGWIGDMIGGQW